MSKNRAEDDEDAYPFPLVGLLCCFTARTEKLTFAKLCAGHEEARWKSHVRHRERSDYPWHN